MVGTSPISTDFVHRGNIIFGPTCKEHRRRRCVHRPVDLTGRLRGTEDRKAGSRAAGGHHAMPQDVGGSSLTIHVAGKHDLNERF